MNNDDILSFIGDIQDFISEIAGAYNIDEAKENELKERIAEIIIEVFNNVI